MKKIVKEN